MKQQTAVVIGATGLTGSHIVEQLLADDAFNAVRILVRKPVALQHPKLQVELVDFNNYEEYKKKLGSGDCIFCCIGTTRAQVKGDEIAYRKIDFDIPVNAARFGKEAGFQQFAIITAATANSKSRIFYNRLKGEVEEVIATFQYQSFHIFRPSFIMGERTEQRLGEKIFRFIFQGVAKLLPASWRPIDAAAIAAAMINATKKGRPGMNLYYYKEMLQK